jgi:histidinol-phosphatase
VDLVNPVDPPNAPDPDLELAFELAGMADSIALSRFRAVDLVVETKPDMSPVSEADRAVEHAIRERIAEARPDDSVIGEEFGEGQERDSGPAAGPADRPARRWIIDPIDGTKNYVRGIPLFAALIALETEGEVTVGVVSAPALRRRWWAVRGRGAFADGTRLSVSRIGLLEDAQVCYSGLGGWRRAGLRDRLIQLTDRSWRSRGFGDFWMHMLVAEGSAEVACETEVRLWDLAAVKVVVEEAGGTFTDLSGRPTADGGSALSTNGVLHAEVLRILGTERADI